MKWRARVSRIRAAASNESGSVMIETALMITILLVLLFGIIDIGRALYTANSLVSAVREGARYAAIDQNLATDTLAIKDTVRVHFNQYTFGSAAMVRDSVKATPQFDSNGNIASILVKVNYPFKWITPIPRLLGWTTSGSLTTALHAQAQYRYEF